MHERLQLLIKEYSLTSSRFAEILGIQPSAVSHLISGRNKPGFEILSRILDKFPDVNPRWLILGESPVYLKERVTGQISDGSLLSGLYDPEPESAPVVAKDEVFKHPQSAANIESVLEQMPLTGLEFDMTISDLEPDKVPASAIKQKADIQKIIILYTDGTFDSFENK